MFIGKELMKFPGIFVILMTLFFSQAFAGPFSVAVLEFDATGMDSTEASQVTNFLRQRLATDPEIQIVPAGSVRYSITEVTTDNSVAIQLGQTLAADFVITASLGKIGDLFTVDAKLLNVNTTECFVKDGSYEGNLELFLINTVATLADEMLKLMQPPEQLPPSQPVTLDRGHRWYKKWWLWAGVGSAAIIGGVLAQGDGGGPDPEKKDPYLPEPPALP